MYKNGSETKQNIEKSAKKLFYEYGYRKVSVSAICREADVKLGTFTYYFPKKEDLLRHIYTEYMNECRSCIDTLTDELDAPARHLHIVMLYYGNIYRDNNIIRFHRDILDLGSMNVIFSNSADLIRSFSSGGGMEKDSAFYELAIVADNAVRRELNINFIDNEEHTMPNVKTLIHNIYSVNARLFGIEQQLMDSYLSAAYDFYTEHFDLPAALL